MLESYAALETKLSAPADAPKDAPAEDSVANPDATEGEEGEAPEFTYSEAIDSAMTAAELAPADVAAEWAEKGELTEATRSKLDASFGKDAVDMYIEGWKSKQAAAAEEAPATEGDPEKTDAATGPTATEQTTLVEEIGGDEVYTELLTWAKDNLTDAERDRYNEQVNKDVNAARMSLAWLQSKRETVEGVPPRTILKGDSKGGAATDVYENMVEVTRDMSARDERGKVMYKEDQAYRNRVRAKLDRSDV
jgi:hypothetical protein